MWLKELKIAIIEQNIEQIERLVSDLPELHSPQDIDAAIYLLEAAATLVTELRDTTQASMRQMQKSIKFLKATQAPLVSKLDINS